VEKYYGQLKQDLLAQTFFTFNPVKNKIFLDIGAFDGITYSNTYLLFKHGWRGVCIEPCLKNYKKLEKLYSDTEIVTIRAAAADYIGKIELNIATIPGAEEYGSDVSSAKSDVLEKWKNYIWEKENVPAVTINKILEKNNIKIIDFVSIDVEGFELAVLKGFNLEKYKPKLILIEYCNKIERSKLVRHLKLQNYFLWSDNGQDIFMVYGRKSMYLNVLFNGLLYRYQWLFKNKMKKIIKKMKKTFRFVIY
jgi:FkbM family methyltransferase